MSKRAQTTKPPNREIPATNSIMAFFHCRQCIAEMPDGESPSTWARYSTGLTELGIQVWCDRHDCNIVHIDFEGCRHPANQQMAVAAKAAH